MPAPALISLLVPVIALAGQDRHVPGDYTSIQSAISACADGDRVLVGPGTWTGSVDTRNLAITIESTQGATATILDAGDSGTVFKIIRGEGPETIIRGFTITGGTGELHETLLHGGGMWILNSSPTVEDCHIIGNVAQMGGGASVIAGNPTFTNCVFEDNFATTDGGGIRFTDFSFPTLSNVEFLDNGASVYGGGLNYAFDSLGMHQGCTFDGNTAGVNGGSISMTCDCSAANVQNSVLCNSQPNHVEGPWNDLGGNDVCSICYADITADGTVDVNDILAIFAAWGGCVCVEDITNDSAVSVDDLLIVISQFGSCG
ncbi:MAG: hypothetical protein MK074_09125 [Phycisphaerales bacterium]|nr:hypothetical protein [Phycisphaerales bacterium]